jgi:hypothetical protein
MGAASACHLIITAFISILFTQSKVIALEKIEKKQLAPAVSLKQAAE